MMKSYEIHTYFGGIWKIDSIFDDQELALSEGRRILTNGRFSAVRVIEETFNPDTNEVRTRTIYRNTLVDDSNQEAIKRQAELRQEQKDAPKKTTGRERYKQKKHKESIEKSKNQAAMLALKFGIILIVGVAILAVLQIISEG